jgi:hypothetical protein
MALPAGVVVSRPWLMQEQVNPEGVQLGQEADQVLQAAAETIDGPGHHDIELALSGVAAQRVEGRALVAALILPRRADAASDRRYRRRATSAAISRL